MIHPSVCALFFWLLAVRAQQKAAELAASYSLTTSTSFPFPTATLSNTDTQALIVSSWGPSKGRIQDGGADLSFVADPFPSSGSAASVSALQVTYPAGSFSHSSGGAQFYSVWNSTTTFQSMMISYEVAFDKNFDFVKGGKLPGLRGGVPNGCSGGNEPTGTDCFSARLMWRPNGNGEVYAYIPTPNNLCGQKSITCNDDFGVSVSRGSFILKRGEWNRVTLLVRLNTPVDTANGNIQLYFNDVNVLNQKDLQFRSNNSLSANGMYFSTFFGGADDSWATPVESHTYYRNIQLWAGEKASDLTGQHVNNAFRSHTFSFLTLAASFAVSWTIWITI